MTGWIIFGSIVLFFVWLFTRHAVVTAVYDKNPEVTVKFLFFTVFRLPENPKRKKKEKKKRSKKKKAAEEPLNTEEAVSETKDPEASDTETAVSSETAEASETKKKKVKPKKEKKKLDIDLGMIMDYVRSAAPPIKRLFKKIKFRNVYLDYVVGTDDAAKTALKYGGLCAAIYPVIEWLTTYFDFEAKEINIEADFSAEKDDIFAYGVIKLRVSTALGCAIWLLVRVIKTYLKYNKAEPVKVKAKPKPRRVKGR